LGGLLIGQIVGTVVALRLSGLGWSAFGAVRRSAPDLLRGTLWLFLTGVGVPVGMQAGRVLLAHFSTPLELSEYALMAQLYAVCWVAFNTAGFAFWPIFVKRRGAAGATLTIWARMTVVFTTAAVAVSAVLVPAAPWAGRILTGGTITIGLDLSLAFAVLLVGQCAYLATSMLLTRPEEARLQALWALAMAAISIGTGIWGAARFGALGVVYAAAAAVVIAQVIPALLRVPRLVRRRPEAPS
jgi:hypothetical protein